MVMKYFSYAWSIIENTITLIIAWLLYSIANTNYEIIVVSLLLVIYAHIVSSSSGIALEVVLSEIRATKQFMHILQVLKRNDSDYKEYKEIRKGIGDDDDINYFDNNPLEHKHIYLAHLPFLFTPWQFGKS
jgi:hypothetical protein